MSQKPMTLLERKRLQWDKEKEELIGLCSPWGRPPSLKLSTSCTSLAEGMRNLSTNLNKNGQSIGGIKRSPNPTLIPSNYLRDLGHTNSQSECHLPPIGLEKQKGHDSDEFHEFVNAKGKNMETPHWFNRKRSLPSCILTTTGEVCSQSRNFGQEETFHSNNNFHHATGRDVDGSEEKYQPRHFRQVDKWSNNSLEYHQEEDPHTSGYQSENNPGYSGGSGESRNGSGDSEKDPQLLRRYFSSTVNMHAPGSVKSTDDRNPHNAPHYLYTSEMDYFNQNPNGWTKPGSYLYSKRNEMDHYELEQLESRHTTKSLETESLEQKTWSYVNSRIHIPPPAMRSSFTNSIEAPDRDAYKDIKKQEHEKWLRDLEQQRDEQRTRKLMEKEEKTGRAKWGDRGVVVGHLWEPASIPDARLPPRAEGDGNFSSSGGGNEGKEIPPPRWTVASSQFGDIFDQTSGVTQKGGVVGMGSDQGETSEVSEREQKMQKAMQHQEALRKQMEERQQKLKEAQERRIDEERAEESQILTYRLEQLKKLEFNQRQQLIRQQEAETQQNGGEIMENRFGSQGSAFTRGDKEHHVFQRQQEVENAYLMRKNLTTSFSLPTINPLESPIVASPNRRRSISPFEEYEATVLKEPAQFDTLASGTPNISQTVLRTTNEFGTQTELREESAIEGVPENQDDKELTKLTKLTSDGADAEPVGKKICRKKERPKWGVPPPTKQYLKQSEKDPHYQLRLQRRRDRQNRREQQIKFVRSSMALALSNGKADESEDSQSQKEKKLKAKSKQKSMSNINASMRKEDFDKSEYFPTAPVTEANGANDRDILERTTQETYNTLPNIKKQSTPMHKGARKARGENVNAVDPSMNRSSPTISMHGKPPTVEEMPEFLVNGEEFRKTDSPPVPALMNKMNHSNQIGKKFHSISFPDEDDEDGNFFGKIPEDRNAKKPIFHLPRQSPKPNPPERTRSSENSEQESDPEPTPPLPLPKMSPATLVIESSADYFKGPMYFGSSHSARSSVKSEQTLSYYNPIPLDSPPTPLKQLMYGIQNLGSYLPMTPAGNQQLISDGDGDLFASELKNSRPNTTIEFTIKFPAEYCRQNFQGVEFSRGKSGENIKNGNVKGNDVEEYRDPLVEERKKSTIEWIHSNPDETSESRLNHLSALKKGIRMQQEEWGVILSDSEIGASPYGSGFYPSSERSSSSE